MTARPLTLAALLAVGAVLALTVDMRVFEWASSFVWPRELWKVIQLSEVFGHVLSVVVAVVLIWRLDAGWRHKVPTLLSATIAAGLVANVVKLLVMRTRPSGLDFAESVFETFGGVVPLVSAGSGGQSFPSGHSALAAALAWTLARFYPRAAWLFAVLASLVMLHRIATDSHFVSDVLAGAALGIVVAELVASWVERSMRQPVLPPQPPAAAAGFIACTTVPLHQVATVCVLV